MLYNVSKIYNHLLKNVEVLLCVSLVHGTFEFSFIIYILLSFLENLGHLTWLRQQQHYPVLHGGSFHVSIIHQTFIWTTGSLTCVRDHSYVCVYTWGLDTLKACQHIFDSEKLSQYFFILLTGFELRVFGARVRRSTK